MRNQLCLAAVLAILSAPVEAADREERKEQYLCIAEQSAGFRYDKNAKQWESTTFSDRPTFVISKPTVPDAEFQFTKIGDSYPSNWCEKSFKSLGKLYCQTITGEFRFNKTNGRFILSSLFGYVEVGHEANRRSNEKMTDDKADTPYMQIGKCSQF